MAVFAFVCILRTDLYFIWNDSWKLCDENKSEKISNPQKRINIFQSFLRYFFKTIFEWISFITIFISKNNRSIHDYIGGSIVVKV